MILQFPDLQGIYTLQEKGFIPTRSDVTELLAKDKALYSTHPAKRHLKLHKQYVPLLQHEMGK